MSSTAKEGAKIAIEKGSTNEKGVPMITVITEGAIKGVIGQTIMPYLVL